MKVLDEEWLAQIRKLREKDAENLSMDTGLAIVGVELRDRLESIESMLAALMVKDGAH